METPVFSSRKDYWTAPTSIKSTRETRRSTSKPESSSFDHQKRVDLVFVLMVVDHKGLMNQMGNIFAVCVLLGFSVIIHVQTKQMTVGCGL